MIASTRRRSVPSASTIQIPGSYPTSTRGGMFDTSPCAPRTKAMVGRSGDQVGLRAVFLWIETIRRLSLPSALIVYSDAVPSPRATEYASREPSGDHLEPCSNNVEDVTVRA